MLITHADIRTMEEENFPHGFVRVLDGKINAVGSMDGCPRAQEGEEQIDLAGRLLLPGFVDAHSHIGLFESGLGAEGDDTNEDTDPSTPQVRALDGVNPFDPAFAEARLAGMTCAVISPGSANPVAGQICAVKTAGRWVDQMAVKTLLAVKFSLGENPKMSYGAKNQTPMTRMATAAIIREQLAKAKRYLEDKLLAEEDEDEEISPPDLDVKCEALLPLLRREIQAHFHAHRAYDILTAVRIAEEFDLRYAVVHCTEGHLIADILGEKGVSAICGPILNTRTKPELSGVTLETCGILARAGVSLAISTDHPEVPADFLAPSAAMAVSGGLNPAEALRALTINAAKAVGLESRVGSILPGKDADLQVYDRDPLEGYRKPELVWIDGVRVK